MCNNIFKDELLQKDFDENGYVKVPLLNTSEIDLLTQLFYKFHSNIHANTFGSSSFLHNKEMKHTIRDNLYPIFQPHFDKLFHNYRYFGSSYLYKTKGKNSDLAPHQDWTIVDESIYTAINIWVPLVDTTTKNGTLYIIPKSQAQKLHTLRAPTIPFFFLPYLETVIRCSVPTNAKAGEAIILNQSLIHYSSSNLTDDIRIAITSGIKSQDAPMLFHYKNEQNIIEQYLMPEDFLLDFDNFNDDIYKPPSKGKLIQAIRYQPPSISKMQFLKQFSPPGLSLKDKILEFFR